MSQRDLTAELRGARIAAPAELRERVRVIAAADTTPTPRFTWRRALVVALPVAAAIAASIVFTRPDHNQPLATQTVIRAAIPHTPEKSLGAAGSTLSAKTDSGVAHGGLTAKLAPPSTPGRVQVYGSYLALRLSNPTAVSNGVKSALRIASSLGGYPASVHATSEAKLASADLVLKIPRAHIQQAITRLSALGTITSENVDIQDKTAGLNATGRTIARLQKQLTELRKQPPSQATAGRIVVLESQIVRLQRAEAATRLNAHYATVQLHLTNAEATVAPQHGHGRLHGVVVALTWLGIGAVYALAIGTPVAILALLLWLGARVIRRRREDALLSRS
jgi:hypothetical protein